MLRSLLFVPADNEQMLGKASRAGADALVLDLEDAVLPHRKAQARALLRTYLAAQVDHQSLWVRVNALSSGELLNDLVQVVPSRPNGIMLPKICGPEDVALVGNYLDAMEAAHDIAPGHTRIIALVTETPLGLLRLGELAKQRHPRISHVSWGAEDLSSAMGAGDPRTPQGEWHGTYVYARSQCLLTAYALGAEAIDTVYVNFKDDDGLRKSSLSARHDGFTGGIAIHPAQVAIINEVFSPSAIELEFARRLVQAFSSGVGAISIDGKMYDTPHFRAAQKLLAQSGTVGHGRNLEKPIQ